MQSWYDFSSAATLIVSETPTRLDARNGQQNPFNRTKCNGLTFQQVEALASIFVLRIRASERSYGQQFPRPLVLDLPLMKSSRKVMFVLAAALLIVVGWGYWSAPMKLDNAGGGQLVQVKVPELQGDAMLGREAFNSNCAACHGSNAAGRDGAGPPLVHKIYEPGHHADAAFFLAAKRGVRSHHWTFGDMPPVEGISDEEIAKIVSYIRALQRANGIS